MERDKTRLDKAERCTNFQLILKIVSHPWQGFSEVVQNGGSLVKEEYHWLWSLTTLER